MWELQILDRLHRWEGRKGLIRKASAVRNFLFHIKEAYVCYFKVLNPKGKQWPNLQRVLKDSKAEGLLCMFTKLQDCSKKWLCSISIGTWVGAQISGMHLWGESKDDSFTLIRGDNPCIVEFCKPPHRIETIECFLVYKTI